MNKEIPYTSAMDILAMTTVGILFPESYGTSQIKDALKLLRKLIQSCLELAADDEASGETESGYTWEEKIETLVKLAKAVGRFTNTDRGTEGYKITREHLIRAYDEFCEWRHDEPYLVDEIKELLGRREYEDVQTGTRLIVENDNPGYPDIRKLTIVCPKDCTLSIEEINETMTRLQDRADIPVEQRMVSLRWSES